MTASYKCEIQVLVLVLPVSCIVIMVLVCHGYVRRGGHTLAPADDELEWIRAADLLHCPKKVAEYEASQSPAKLPK